MGEAELAMLAWKTNSQYDHSYEKLRTHCNGGRLSKHCTELHYRTRLSGMPVFIVAKQHPFFLMF